MRAALLLLLVVTGCGDGGGGDVGPDADRSDPAPDFDDSAARVEVGLRSFGDGNGDLTITARLVEQAPAWPYDVEAPVDGCRYSTRWPMTCAACEYDQTCVEGACVDPPQVRSAGQLTVAGGGVTRAVPFANQTYQHYEAGIPFAGGVELTASAPGDQLDGFALTAVTPAPLALIDRDALRLRIGAPLVVRWTPADPGSRIRLTLGADLGHALHRSALIECDVPDEHGAIAVPQDLVDRLAAPSNWSCGDCFPQEIRRYRRARGSAGAVPVTLWVNQTESLSLVPER